MGDNWETQKHMSNEGRYMSKSSKNGINSVPAKFVMKPSLQKVSESRVNQGVTANRGEYKPGKTK